MVASRRFSALLVVLLPLDPARAQADIPHGLAPGDRAAVIAARQAKPTGTPWAAAGPVPNVTAPAGAVRVPAGADIQAVVDRNPPGTVYLLQSGIHRLQQIVPKAGDTIMGEAGATLNGSRLLRSFRRSGNLFVATGQWPHPGTRRSGECQAGFPRCDYPQDLYVNGRPLRAVSTLAEVGPSTWHFDYVAGKVSIAHDPDRDVVELSHLPFAVGGKAAGVTVRNLVIENYASTNQEAAINHSGAGSDWLVVNNEVRWNHGYGIVLGSGNSVLANKVHHNGQLGIGGGRSRGLRVEGNEIAFNVWNGVKCEWECGGAKWGEVRDLVVAGNWVHDNSGVGLWTDVGVSGVVFEGNLVENNRLAGISHEISHDAVIRNNILCGNGKETFQWGWQAQIQVQNSTNTQVHGNALSLDPVLGGNGITIIEQNRGLRHVSRNVHVYGNTIEMQGGNGTLAGWFADYNAAAFKSNGNWFDRNTYHTPAPASTQAGRLWMANKPADFPAWQASGEDRAGVRTADTRGRCRTGAT